MKNYKVIIALACMLIVAIGTLCVGAYANRKSESALSTDDASSVENSNQFKAISPEEKAYLADMDKKLEEKFGVSTTAPVINEGVSGDIEVSQDLKKELWEMIVNDFELIEKPKEEPEPVFGSWKFRVGNRTFLSSGYYHDDTEYSYFLSYIDDNYDDAQLYKVKTDLQMDLSTRIWQKYYSK